MEISSNGWQNVGIMRQYANKEIETQYKEIFQSLVDMSLAYRKATTPFMYMYEWSKKLNCSKDKFNRHIKCLIKNGHVSTVKRKGFKENGGKYSPAYRVKYPSHANIDTGDGKTKTENSHSEGWLDSNGEKIVY